MKAEQELFLVDKGSYEDYRRQACKPFKYRHQGIRSDSRTGVGVAYWSMFSFHLKIVVQPVSNMMHYICSDKSKCLSNRK